MVNRRPGLSGKQKSALLKQKRAEQQQRSASNARAGGSADAAAPAAGEATARQMVQQVSRGGDTNRLSTAFVREHDQAVQARRLRGSEPFGCAAAAAAPLAFEPAGESLGLPTRARVEGASAAAQEAAERTAFEAWLASVHGGCRADALSPFEHNLEVWRQLWRVVERSDVVCIVADVRNPLLHVPAALYEHCAARPSLRLVIVLSKVRPRLAAWRLSSRVSSRLRA